VSGKNRNERRGDNRGNPILDPCPPEDFVRSDVFHQDPILSRSLGASAIATKNLVEQAHYGIFLGWLRGFFVKKSSAMLLARDECEFRMRAGSPETVRNNSSASGSSGLVGRNGKNRNGVAARLGKNLASEIEPGTDSFVGDVDDPTSISQDQVTNRAGKIASVRGEPI